MNLTGRDWAKSICIATFNQSYTINFWLLTSFLLLILISFINMQIKYQEQPYCKIEEQADSGGNGVP